MKFRHNVGDVGYVAIYKNIKELLARTSRFTRRVAAIILSIGRL